MTTELLIAVLYMLFVVIVCLAGRRWERINRFPVAPFERAEADQLADIKTALRRRAR